MKYKYYFYDTYSMTTLYNEFDYLLEPNQNPDNVSGTFTGTDGKTYYREYSFIDRPFDQSSLREQQLNLRNEILDYKNKEEVYTKAQSYANKVRGITMHRNRTFASKGDSNNRSNPNTKNYLRVDSNKNIINETTKDHIPNIASTLPYMNQIRTGTTYKTQDMIDISYNASKLDKTTIVMPIVQNDDIPVEEEIVDGGVLHAGTNFSDPSDREKIDPSLYKFSEQAIVSSEFANKFNINLEHTYNKEQIEQLTGKTFIELYPDYPSWNRPPQGGVVTFSSVDGKPGNFLPTMYNSTGYTYDNVNNQYIGEEVFIQLFVPKGSSLANGTEVGSNLKLHTVDFTGPAPVAPDADPVINISGSNPVSITQGQTYNDAGATATDAVDGNLTSSISTSSNVNVTLAGTYTVTYSVSDAAGNTATATRTVNVTAGDTTPPVITLNGTNPVTITQGQTYTDQGAFANDDVDGSITNNIQMSSNVNTSSVGTYTVTYTVSDAAGNTTTATRTVYVVADTTPPSIMMIGNTNPYTITQNSTFTDPGATATDNLDGVITSSITATINVNTAVQGTNYSVVYSVTDAAGNNATATRYVHVVA